MPIPLSYSLRSLRARRISTLLTVGGIALVVMVYVVVMGLAHGLRNVFVATGSDDNLVFIRAGATSPMVSRLNADAVLRLSLLPEIAEDEEGRLLLSAETIEYYRVGPKRQAVAVRGVDPMALAVRRGVELAAGSMPARLSEEVVLGVELARILGLRPGDHLAMGATEWTVSGLLSAPGSAYESEAWTDRLSLMRERQGSELNYVIARVQAADLEAARALETRWEEDPSLGVRILPESLYYASLSRTSSTFATASWLLALVMGLAMVITGTNTLYGMLALRWRELGTLRVLGFQRRHLLLAVLAEAVLLGLAGGVAGALLGRLVDGLPFAYVGTRFHFLVGPGLMAQGVGLAVLLGALGGLLPAIRACRLEVVGALRSL